MNERSLARAELLILVSLAVWPRVAVARCGRARRTSFGHSTFSVDGLVFSLSLSLLIKSKRTNGGTRGLSEIRLNQLGSDQI